jgi:hypothetical protein
MARSARSGLLVLALLPAVRGGLGLNVQRQRRV